MTVHNHYHFIGGELMATSRHFRGIQNAQVFATQHLRLWLAADRAMSACRYRNKKYGALSTRRWMSIQTDNTEYYILTHSTLVVQAHRITPSILYTTRYYHGARTSHCG